MDHSDFNRIYDQYYHLVLRAAQNYVQDPHYQEDICQEVFSKLYNKIETLAEEDHVRPWLLVVTKTTALDLRRRLKLDHPAASGEEGQVGETEPLVQDGPEEKILLREQQVEVFRALREQNPEWLKIMVCLEVDGMRQADLAREMGISLTSLRNKIYRARKWLKEHFPQEG
ncbi:MAG: sigma-70 family RNA polymerase sigma factor [Lachnospiraceae bacterium]|nr:sigma-70 family RNA polymerase sigma factor [Lachnospiraceae bacterium]